MNAKASLITALILLFVTSAGCFAQTETAAEQSAVKKETINVPADAGAMKTTKPIPAPNADWPMFRGDTKSTGVARTTLPESLETLWQFKVPKGAFEATAAIVNHNGKRIVYIGDLDGVFFAFDLDTGEKLWDYKVEIGFVTGAAFENGNIYVGDIDGYFYCLDSEGKLNWKHQADAEINSSANFYKDNVLFGSQDTKLYGLNKKTGAVSMEHETADQVRCGITVVDNRAFVAGCDGGLHVVNLDDGTEISSVSIESPTGVTPAVVGETVFVGTEQSGFFAIDWKESRVKWQFQTEGTASIRSCPAVTKGHVIFGAQDRTVYSLDPKNGKKNWSRTLKSKIDSSPVIVGERVFVGATDGRLYGLDLASGEIKWEKELNGGIIGSPAVAFERLVIATDRGVVYCLGSKEKYGQKPESK